MLWLWVKTPGDRDTVSLLYLSHLHFFLLFLSILVRQIVKPVGAFEQYADIDCGFFFFNFLNRKFVYLLPSTMM